MPKQDTSDEALDPQKLFRPIDRVVAEAKPLEPLWGNFFYRKAITSIVADPGTGKTTFGYGLCEHLCLGHNFLDIAPSEPINALFLDFESADSLINSRHILLGIEEHIPNFWIYNNVNHFFSQIAVTTRDFCIDHHINLVFVDNQTTAFNTRDENDNSEASKQMHLLREWVIDTNVGLCLIHHTSKGNLPGTRKGTGAYARARLADIMINMDVPDPDRPDIVMLEVVKNRMVADKTLWYLEKRDGAFLFTEPPMGITKGPGTNTKIYAAQKLLLAHMAEGQDYSMNQLVLEIQHNPDTKVGDLQLRDEDFHNALRKLRQQGIVMQPSRGQWQRKYVNM